MIVFHFNYTGGPIYEVPKGLTWAWTSFGQLFESSSLLYPELTLKIFNTTQGAQRPIRMHAGHDGPACWWVLAGGQCLGHPGSPRKEKGGGGCCWFAVVMQPFVSNCICTQLPFLHVVKNLLINFWKSCKKLDILYPRRHDHLPDKNE